ncbi:hypothetical protein [Oribacterium sp. HCP3S3_B9]|uniref:hypothetical protein n=1 Tax=Oribacterium sp. HCP3S3_B9 TaxID=3438946 RepID=UPI003F8BB870
MLINTDIHKKYIDTIADVMFNMALVLYWSLSIIWSSTAMALVPSRVYLLGMAMVIAVLMLREVMLFVWIRRYNWRDYLGLAIVLLFGYIVDRNETATIAAGYLLIFASRDRDYKKIFRIVILNTIAGIAVIYQASIHGFISYATWTEKETLRHAFGFVYPLVIPAYLLNIGIMTFAVKEEKTEVWQMMVLLFFTICTYRWCKADLSGGLTLAVLIAIVVTKIYPNILRSQKLFWKWTDRLAMIIYPLVAFFSYLGAKFYDGSIAWMDKLNQMIGGRLSLAHAALHDYEIKLLGQEIWFVGSGLDNSGNPVNGNYNYVDNVYVNLLLRYGVVFCIIALVLLVLTMDYCRIRRMRVMLWMFSLMAIHGIFEDKVQTLYFNSLLLMIGQAVQNYHASKKYT